MSDSETHRNETGHLQHWAGSLSWHMI